MLYRLPLLSLALLVGCAAEDQDLDGFDAAADCNDLDPNIHLGANEICDGVDNDCNGVVDDPYASGGFVFFVDVDGDGFGASTGTKVACDAPTGFVENASDCDDTLAAVNPRADEYCNVKDDNCDGELDNNPVDALKWHADWDQDGFGSQVLVELACEAPEGYISDAQDCNDFSATTNPAADEVCDFLDNNCDDVIDEATAVNAREFYADLDNDGYGDVSKPRVACWLPTGHASAGEDCLDTDPKTNPGMPEICRDGADNNCNGSADQCNVSAWKDVANASLVWKGRASSTYLGYDTQYLGDVDGDGFGDFASGAYIDYISNYGEGAVYILYGQEGYEVSTTDRAITEFPSFAGTTSYNYLGRAISPGGDVDGDGLMDFLVGAYGASSYKGSAYLIYGNATRPTGRQSAAVLPSFTGASSSQYAGYSVYTGSDLDGDGYSEVVVGSYAYASYAGGAHFFFGKSDRFSGDLATSAATFSVRGAGTYQYLAYTQGSLGGGDFDGDGYGDFLLASYGFSSYAGVGAVYYGRSTRPSGEITLNDIPDRISGSTSYQYVGYGLGSVGDVNDDGYEDWGIGCYSCAGYAGQLFVKFGSATRPGASTIATYDLSIKGTSSSYLGYARPTHADFNGDGVDDIAVGAYYHRKGGSTYGSGATFVVLGGTDLLTDYDQATVDAMVEGTNASYTYGSYSVAGGDYNGDGIGDLLSGAYGDASYAGRLYLYEGTGL